MAEKVANADLVAFCGLYCGECGKFKRGRCPGCAKNEKATWCKVRTCNMEHGYSTCADCAEFSDPNDCVKLNNFFARTISFVLRSNRSESLRRISEAGRLGYAEDMVEQGRMSCKR